MSVVVIGIEMPESCETCKMNTKDAFGGLGCRVKNLIPIRKQNEFTPNWCNLRPFPDAHGRLIDADAFEIFVQNKWEQNEISNGDWMSFREWLRDQETIIEAEGGSDE